MNNSIERDKQPKSAHELVSGLNSLREYYIETSRNTMFEAIQRNPNLQVAPEVPEVPELVQTPEVNNVTPMFRPVAPEARVSNEQLNDTRLNQYTKPVIVTPVNPTPDPVDLDYQNMIVKPVSELDRIRADVDRATAFGMAANDPSLAVLRPDYYNNSGQNMNSAQRPAA